MKTFGSIVLTLTKMHPIAITASELSLVGSSSKQTQNIYFNKIVIYMQSLIKIVHSFPLTLREYSYENYRLKM